MTARGKRRAETSLRRARVIVDGAIAGILGALAVAIWFLIFDIGRGRPFETPTLLGTVLLHGAGAAKAIPATALILEYSALHFCAFILFGIAASLLMEASTREPALLISVVIFFGAFEVFFIALVMLLGPAVMAAVSWWSILVGNLLATAVMVAYFVARHQTLTRELLGPWTKALREGILTGIVGGLIVALWFLARDAALGVPMRTPALLGAALLYGLHNPDALVVSAAPVLGYSILHFGAFVGFGLVAAFLLMASEREPMLLLGVFIVFACFEVFFLGAVTLIDSSLLDSIGWWTVVIGNILATAGMLGCLWARHPKLRARLVERWLSIE